MTDSKISPAAITPAQLSTAPDDQSDVTPSQPSLPPPPVLPPSAIPPAQSMQYLSAEIQRQWNWGAFFLTPFWLASMRIWKYFWVYLGITAVIILINVLSPAFMLFARFIPLGFTYWLARNANLLAWHSSRKWESEQQFVATQRVWKYWSIGLLIAVILLVIAVSLFGE